MNTELKGKIFTVFLDFDNTISTNDVLDDMLERFSADDNWMRLEDKWKKGEIGSRECLKGQVEGLRMTKKDLDKYLLTVQIDPYFGKLLDFLNDKKIRTMILSDNFDYILGRILNNFGVAGLEVYSNKIDLAEDRLKPSFPLSNKDCGGCAHCKKTTLLGKLRKDEMSIYAGDGRSDLCASSVADIVFAKDYLKEHCRQKGIAHIPIEGLKDIYDYLKEKL